MHLPEKWKRKLAYVGIGVFATAVVTLIILNLLPQEKRLAHDISPVSAVDSPQFCLELSSLLGPAVLKGNRIDDLENGDEIFPAMLAAIRAARRSVDLETYIYWSGAVSDKFVAALDERASAGVAVHVLVDWIGASKMRDSVTDRLRAAGVEFEYFHPLQWYTIDRLNNRTHRKLLIVDGRVAFTGGVGIADDWSGDADRPDRWRDMQFRVEGPVVSQFQAVFEDNWITTTGEVLLGTDYYPMLRPAGEMAAQMFASSPEGGSENMQLMYLMAINGARSSIDLEAAYFLPDDLMIDAFERARRRGVRIRVIVPGPYGDSQVVRDASQAMWGTMLKAGAHLYRFQPSKFHNKMMIVDDYLTIVGSANFDNRSLKLNDEANLNVFDAGFARHMTSVVDRDIARSREVTIRQWERRPWTRKIDDWLSSLTFSQI
ncbi:MAG: phospholipase D-like domain-containing protein [Rhodanobacteraceae bacterium]